MNDVYLLIGGNMGDRLKYLQRAGDLISQSAGQIIKKSSLYETAAWGLTDQESFLNQAIHLQTDLDAPLLLKGLLDIERTLGRERFIRMGPRVIDIDILFYNRAKIESRDLTIPHPGIAERRFVLVPLNEIASGFVHPVYQRTVHELLQICSDPLEVKKFPLSD